MIEEWRPIDGFQSYEVSSLGRVRRSVRGKTIGEIGHVLKSWLSAGYPTVCLVGLGKKEKHSVHVLVCRAFHGPKPSLRHEVAHNNGIKTDCSKINLRWALRAENHADKLIHGTDNRGEKHGMAKLTDSDADVIRNYPKGRGTGSFLAKRFGVASSLVSMIRNGKIRNYPKPLEINESDIPF